MNGQHELEPPNEDQVFAYTHGIRKQIVTDLLKAGIPSDPDNVKVVLTTLKDMDSSALGRKRIKADETVAANQAEAASLIAKLLGAAHHNRGAVAVVEGQFTEVLVLPDDIPDPVLVPDETSTKVTQQSYDDFMAQFPPLVEDAE